MVLDLCGVNIEEIANALADQTDYEHQWLIDPQTGQIAFWTADTGRAGRKLLRAIEGKGAFRRFKGELHREYPELLPAWYMFREPAQRAVPSNGLPITPSSMTRLPTDPDRPPRSRLALSPMAAARQ